MAKAKDGSECYTRVNKSGGKYITCEGTQKGSKGKKVSPKPKPKPKPKKMKKEDEVRPVDKNVPKLKKDKFKNLSNYHRDLLESGDILENKKKTLKEDIKIFKQAGNNYDERRVKDYRIAVKTAIGASQRFGYYEEIGLGKFLSQTPLGTDFIFANDTSTYFPLPRAKITESTKEQKEQKKKAEEAKDKKQEEFMKRTEDAEVLWNKYKDGNWDKYEKQFLEQDLNKEFARNTGTGKRAEIIETGKTKIKKFIIYYKIDAFHTRWKKTRAYRLPKEFQ